MPLTPFFTDDPGTVNPGWPVAHMLMVTAIELRNPVALLIAMKRKNFSLHNADLILPWGT